VSKENEMVEKSAAEHIDDLVRETAEPFRDVTRLVFTAILEGHERADEVAAEIRQKRDEAT
jgi:hypothetical protein